MKMALLQVCVRLHTHYAWGIRIPEGKLDREAGWGTGGQGNGTGGQGNRQDGGQGNGTGGDRWTGKWDRGDRKAG